ncbi:MAG: GNAT family N-acetyltransferase [Myxococcota bacterium]
MDPATRSLAEQFWAKRLSCAEPVIREPGLHLVPHPSSASIFVVAIGSSVIAAAPPDFHNEIAELLPDVLIEPSTLAGLVPGGATFIGPAFVGYASSFEEPPPDLVVFPNVRSVEFGPLKAAVPDQEWLEANLEAAEPPVIGVLSGGSVIAAAGAEPLLGLVAHLGVATHPHHRGRGLARRVVSAVALAGVEAGLLPQYQTLFSNRSAIRVGEALGFEQFATTLAVRWGSAAV